MNEALSVPLSGRRWWPLAASLVPWLALLVSITVADYATNDHSVSLVGLAFAAPFSLGFVALPSYFPLAAASPGWMRRLVLAVMTAVATFAGVSVVTTDDAQAGLAVLWVPLVAVALGVVLWVVRVARSSREASASRPGACAAPTFATMSERLAALAIDVMVVGAVVTVPVSGLADAHHEVAAGFVALAAATLYLAVPVAAFGATLGQSVLRLRVGDAVAARRVGLGRSLVRSLIVVLEVGTAVSMFAAAVGLADLIVVSRDDRSFADRLMRTTVTRTLSSTSSATSAPTTS